MDNFYFKGELLRVHMKTNELYEGRFLCISDDKTKFSLYDVKGIDPKQDISEGVYNYYFSELFNIIKMQSVDTDSEHFTITPTDYATLQILSKKHIYINQVNNRYHKAVDDLNSCSIVAVSTDGATMGRKGYMSVLVMSTPEQVYIFDIQIMSSLAFEAGLRKLLEGDNPRKIIHDCRLISDCLYHKHRVKLSGVFDTQVANVIVTKNRNGHLPKEVMTLSGCLNLNLGLPFGIIEEKIDFAKCTERPLSENIKDTFSKNIIFLHRLYEEINQALRLPFERGIECYLQSLRSVKDDKALQLSGKLDQYPREFRNCISY